MSTMPAAEKQYLLSAMPGFDDLLLKVLWETMTKNGGLQTMDKDVLKAFYDEFERRPGLLESMTNESRRRNTMKITKGKLKRIIREEYSKLKAQGLLTEIHGPTPTIMDLASRPEGVHIDELLEIFGQGVFEELDELESSGLIYMEDDGTVISLRGY